MSDFVASRTLASDKMRITDFESVLTGLLDTLDDPHAPNIDFPKFMDALRSFAGFRKHGCHIHIFTQFEGVAAPSAEELKSNAYGASVHMWNHPLVELLAPISSIDIVSFAGPGFFLLLGATNRRIREALVAPSPTKYFTILWAEEVLHSALQGRLRICDALAPASSALRAVLRTSLSGQHPLARILIFLRICER